MNLKRYPLICLLINAIMTTSLSARNYIVVSKWTYHLFHISETSDTIISTRCSVGKKYGQKKKRQKTHEGFFRIVRIQNSQNEHTTLKMDLVIEKEHIVHGLSV